jgi:hypothetical protein
MRANGPTGFFVVLQPSGELLLRGELDLATRTFRAHDLCSFAATALPLAATWDSPGSGPTVKFTADLGFPLVEVRGFEPLTPAVRRQCSTGLSYTPGTAPG